MIPDRLKGAFQSSCYKVRFFFFFVVCSEDQTGDCLWAWPNHVLNIRLKCDQILPLPVTPGPHHVCVVAGKWFNYGIIFLVLILDLNMWKNQIFYRPYEYGQYVGPGDKIYTVEEPETLVNFNHSTLTYKWRSTNLDPNTNLSYVERDMFLHSRYTGASLDVKCLAFIPSLAAFVLFGFFIWLFGRFQDSETFTENQDKTYERIKRKSPSEYSKEMGVTPEEAHVSMSDSLKPPGTPVLLSVDAPPSESSTVSAETRETQPCTVSDGNEEAQAVASDVQETVAMTT